MITINSIKKTILLAGGLFLPVLSVNADNAPTGLNQEMLLPKFNQMSPEAASLGRYGAFQVSEYSGAANISIPLYTVKSGDVSFPINLYYDATGIKVEQDATMVGLGWNLSYGGMISHIVCGKDDFRESTGFTTFNQNYWNRKLQQGKSDWNDLPFAYEPVELPGGINAEGNFIYLDNHNEEKLHLYNRMANGYDAPDVYQASFCGHNISFVIDKRAGIDTNTGFYPITILNDNSRKYKISYNYFQKGQRVILGAFNNIEYPASFTIIDDKGFSYVFNASKYSEIIDSNEGVDSYYLTKIYGPDGENGKSTVKFDYEQISYNIGKSRDQSKDHQPTAKRIWDSSDIEPYFLFQMSSSSQSLSQQLRNIYNRLVGNETKIYQFEIGCDPNGYCHRVYPKTIITAFETIVFIKDDRSDIKGAKCISGITIKPQNGSTPRKINFYYDKFSETPAKEYHRNMFTHERLKLTSVKIDDQNYVFEYDDSIKLPSFASYSKDYWGYYNGANPDADKFVGCSPTYAISNGKVVPVEHYLEGSNRLASEKLCKVGMLKKITYPTGGYTLYEFEANRFNDKYYYPDASHNISFPAATTRHDVATLSLYSNPYRTMTDTTMQITPTQENVELVIDCQLYDKNDNLDVTVTNNSSGNLVWSHYYYHKGIKNFGDTISLSLTKGVTYTIEMKLKAAASSGSNTCASCLYRYYVQNTNITASPTTKNENGGYSIGGGVRVKTIKNYDSDGTYLNGVKYEYSGGKLLSPTVQLEKHFIDFKYTYRDDGDKAAVIAYDTPARFSFLHANTEPSYPYICSLGIPATVGYDQVVKKEIDKNGIVLRKTVFDFHNWGYETDDINMSTVTTRMQNTLYFNSYYGNNPVYPQGHLNGKLKTETRYSDTGKTTYVANYDYYCTKQGSILYPKCIPLHIDGFRCDVSRYDLAFYVKHIAWTYLTEKTETLYDGNGKMATSNTTSFQYNPTNYQLSDLTVTDGTNTSRTHYSYPASNTLRFMHHNLSEVDGVETYKNGTFTGGSKNTYKVHKNPQTGASFSVVEKCCSLLPDARKSPVAEMTVTSYDDYGNIREYTKKNGTPVTIIWSYNHQLPVLEIVGKKYKDVKEIFGSLISAMEEDNINWSGGRYEVCGFSMEGVHASINSAYKGGFSRGAAEAYVTAYEYSPWGTVSRIIKPNGLRVEYVYDTYGRLKETKENGGVIQRYSYNYKNKLSK